jgi:hypothetical protein
MNLSTHTEAIRAMWLVKCIESASEELEKPIMETADLLDKHGLVEWILNGYGSFHTQGYEYMGELLSNTLFDVQELKEHGVVSRDL